MSDETDDMSDKAIEWNEGEPPLVQLRVVKIERFEQGYSIDEDLRAATRKDLLRACEAAGIVVVDDPHRYTRFSEASEARAQERVASGVKWATQWAMREEELTRQAESERDEANELLRLAFATWAHDHGHGDIYHRVRAHLAKVTKP
jgi:hypothetical protein